MNGKALVVFGLFAMLFVVGIMFSSVTATSNVSKIQSELIDDLIKPTTNPILTYQNKNVVIDRVALKKEKPDYKSTPGFHIPTKSKSSWLGASSVYIPIKLLGVKN